MGTSPGSANRGLIITVVIGVLILHAALFTALAFHSDTPQSAGLPPIPPAVAHAPAPQPTPAPAPRLSGEPLRVSPQDPVGMASDAPLPATKGLTGGGKALDQ